MKRTKKIVITLPERYTQILLQLQKAYSDNGSHFGIYLANEGLIYEGKRVNLWGGCNSGGPDSICKCYGGCSIESHQGKQDNEVCKCKGDKFVAMCSSCRLTKIQQRLASDLADLIHLGLIYQYKGNIYLHNDEDIKTYLS